MNYKIKVENKAESKEAQELFFELGGKPHEKTTDRFGLLIFSNGVVYVDHVHFESYYTDAYSAKEITLPQLRDLVVLKRNDATDCTHWHVTGQANLPYLFAMGEWYFFGRNGWEKSTHTHEFYNRLKPIEKKEMKEYLVKNENTGAYDLFRKYPDFSGESDIEIPEGAEEYKANGKFYKENSSLFCLSTMEWTRSKLKKNAYPALWQRHTQLEELPFIDNEPSLNDQYADIERVRQVTISGHVAANLPDFEPFKPDSLINSLIDSNLDESKYHQLDNSDINFRVAKAFNEIRGTDLTEDDIHFLRELINSVTNHYGD